MIERRIGYQDGTIGYNSGGNRPKPNGSKPPFDLDKWLQEIDPGGWMDEDEPNDEARKINRDGIMRVASAKDDKDYLKMILSRYYTPNELFGKTIKELNKMLEMYINVHGGLI